MWILIRLRGDLKLIARAAWGESDLCEELSSRLPSSLLISLSLQENASHQDTFEPKTLSVPKEFYEKIVASMHLPLSWIETSSAVGPFFWSGLEQNGGNTYLRK